MAQSLQIKKVNWWHERMIDLMIAHPEKTQNELAGMLNVSVAWFSIVKNSDVFKDAWAMRSNAHSVAVTNDIKAKAFAASEMALDAVIDRLEQNASVMPVDTLLNVVDTTMKRLGYSNDKDSAPPQINMQFIGVVSPEQLEQARERMRNRTEVKALEVVAHPATVPEPQGE